MSHLDIAKLDLFYVAIVLGAGLIAGVIARRIKVPDIFVFLVIGIGLGPVGCHLLGVPQDSTMNQLILTAGACYLLFEGGTTLQFSVLKEVWITLLVLATVGICITGAVTATFAVLVGFPVLTALLLAGVTASTDPAALVPIFKQIPIRPRVAQTVMSESAFNDAMAAIATFTVVEAVLAAKSSGSGLGFDPWTLVSGVAWESGAGILIGLVFGLIASLLIAHRTFGFLRGVESLVLLLSVILAYLAADQIKASGFMAVFVLGVVTGNRGSFHLESQEHHQVHLEHHVGTTSLVMRMFIFILLGSQIEFGQLALYWWQGLVLLGVFMFIARPLTVFLCAGPDRRAKWTLQELLFMSWTRETGVIPAALVGILAGLKVPGMDLVAPVTFIFILGTLLIQAPTTAWVARRLGLLVPEK